MWSCEYCYGVNAKIWRAKLFKSVLSQIESGVFKQFAFLTITLPSEYHNSGFYASYAKIEAGCELIRKNWDTLIKRLKRWLGKFEYIRVLETHKSGVLHIHLLVTANVPDAVFTERKKGDTYWRSETLLKHATECGFGEIHDAQNLRLLDDNDDKGSLIGIVSYVTKYLTKNSQRFDEVSRRKKIRKIQCSKKFLKNVTASFESGLEWEFSIKPLDLSEYYLLKMDGYEVLDTQLGILKRQHFDREGNLVTVCDN
jgi:hypothetical protein